jgi:uncharacterized protein (DUF433 family)
MLRMVAAARKPKIAAQIVSDDSILGGTPVVRGTRVPAATIVAYLRAGHSAQEIFEDYPSLPVDGIDAVIAWMESEFVPSRSQVSL